MIHHLPNILTVFRIILTPVFIYILFLGGGSGYPLALAIFIAAGTTDIIDGYLARRLNVESTIGKLLDPAADKILVLSAFISFVTMDLIYLWMVIVIILRDVLVTALRSIQEKRNMPMATRKLAKAKTAIQITSIIVILSYLSMKVYQVQWFAELVESLHLIMVFMYLTVIFTVYTGIDYLIANRASIRALVRTNTP